MKKAAKTIGLTTEPLEDLIKKGHTLDFRLNEPEWEGLKIGDTIVFEEDPTKERSVYSEIKGLLYYDNFSNLVKDLQGALIPHNYANHLLQNLFQWWTKEEEEKYGVLAIRVAVIDVQKNKISSIEKMKNIVAGNLSSYTNVIKQSDSNEVIYKKDEWTVKDIIGHIATWNNEALQSINAGLSGSSYQTDFTDGDEFNKKKVIKLRNQSMSQIINMWTSTHKGFLKALEKLEKKNSNIVYPWGAKGDTLHLIEHMMEHEERHMRDIMNHFSKQRVSK